MVSRCTFYSVLFVNDASSVPFKLRHLYKSRLKLTASELALFLDRFEILLLFVFYSAAKKKGAKVSERERETEDFKANSDR